MGGPFSCDVCGMNVLLLQLKIKKAEHDGTRF